MSAPSIIAAMADEIRSSGIALADHQRLVYHLHGLKVFSSKDIGQHFGSALKRAMGTNRARRAA